MCFSVLFISIDSNSKQGIVGTKAKVLIDRNRKKVYFIKLAIVKKIFSYQQYKFNSKIAHKVMKKFSHSQQHFKEQNTIKCTVFQERQLLTPKTPINPIILQREAQSQSGEKQDGRLSMDHLCKVFLERFGSQINCQFDAKQLVQSAGVKQRRIYDLLNILEGCGFMKRLSKGKYIWFSFKSAQSEISPKGRKKQPTSLSNLAARVKDMLYSSQDYIDFKEICLRIIQENVQISPNQDSIKRRVYECCKILKILGVIVKKGQAFKWVSQKERQATINKDYNMKSSLDLFETKGKQLNQKQSSNEKQLIASLLRDVHSEMQLHQLLGRIKESYHDKERKLLIRLNSKRLFKQE